MVGFKYIDMVSNRIALYILSCISGTALKRSATRPKSATWKMGASASLLMATISFESFMPAKCWIAPEIPTATYSSGATILPVCPTCMSLGTMPASTAARDAPTAAPILSAKSYSIWKLSPLFIPLPPLMTTLALASSGRSDLLSSWPTHSELEVVPALHSPSAADDDLGAGQLRTVRLAQLLAHPLRVGGRLSADLVLGGAAALALVCVEGGGAHGQDLDRVLAPQGHHRVASVDGSDERLCVLDADDVGDGGDVQLGGDARQHRAADGRGTSEDVAELELLLRRQHDRRQALRQEPVVHRRLRHYDFGESP